MHQVLVAALYVLIKVVYDKYVEKAMNADDYDGVSADAESSDLIALPFDKWPKQLCALQPQVDYWFKSMELDLLILQFVKSCRTTDFSLYMEILDYLMPWVFELDHTQCSEPAHPSL